MNRGRSISAAESEAIRSEYLARRTLAIVCHDHNIGLDRLYPILDRAPSVVRRRKRRPDPEVLDPAVRHAVERAKIAPPKARYEQIWDCPACGHDLPWHRGDDPPRCPKCGATMTKLARLVVKPEEKETI